MLAHVDHGGSGTPVVLLHAFPLHSGMWDATVAALTPAVRAITVDLPGLGSSAVPAEEPTVELCAAGVVEVLDHLGVAQAVVVGLSTGGYVAAALLREHPGRVSALCLASTTTRVMAPDEPAARRETAAELERSDGLAAVMDAVDEGLGRTARAEQPELASLVTGLVTDGTPAGVAWVARAVAARSDTSETLRASTVPLLLLFGDEDTATPLERAHELRALRPDAELVVLARTGHLTAVERPVEVADRILALARRT